MRLPHGTLTTAIVLGLVSMASRFAIAQAAATSDASSPGAAAQTPATRPSGSGTTLQSGQSTGQFAAPSAPYLAPAALAKKIYEVPAGTKVLLQLRSGLNTASAKPGDGVYLASTFPVVVGNRVMIPAGVYVQGVVDRVARAGRVKGRAQLDMHFTSIIFPNGSVVEIPGIVNSLPGARKQSVKDDGEGTIEQQGDKGRNAAKAAEIAIPTGGTVGSIGGLPSGHPLAGGVAGIAAGVATVGLVSLFTRGADVNIESGTQVEMILQRPLLLEEENLASVAPGFAPAFIPAANQPKPLAKPDRARILCPPGGLGCE
jgi:type IV secretion system protein VirB10